jgi:predicted Zn finger-like uncharacterized protein
MFIVCPSCSGPYSIPADQIAPLVQVACPHCEHRIILDFEAANDPSLREPGHQFAQGYESAEAYFSVYSHVTKNPDAKPHVSPGISAQAAAEVKQAVGATTTPPLTPPLTPAKPTATATATAGTQAPSTPLSSPLGQQPAGSSRNAKTVIHTGSKKPVPLDPAGELLAPRPKQPSGPTMRPGHGTEKLSDDAAAATPAATTATEPERRTPPHTPPVASAVSSGPTTPDPVVPTKTDDPASQSHSQLGKTDGDKPAADALKPIEIPPKTPEAVIVKPTETSSSKWVVIVIILLILAVVGGLVLVNRP